MRRFLLFLVLAALVGGGTAISISCWPSWSGAEVRLANPSTRQEEGYWTVVCHGQVDVEGGILSLSLDQPGRVVEVAAREGASLPQGAVLLRLDDSQAEAVLRQVRAALQFAEAQLAQAQNNLEQQPVRIAQQRASVEAAGHRVSAARRIVQRKRELFKNSLNSSAEVALAEEKLQELIALARVDAERLKELELSDPTVAVREAQAKVEECRAAVRQAEYARERCTLKAPEAGTILRVQVGVGEVVGGPSGRPSVVFCPDRPLLVRAEVEQEFIGRVAVGQAARVEDEGNPILSRNGRVTRVANWYSQRRTVLSRPGELTDIPTVECIISLEDGSSVLRLGQRVKVKIGASHQERSQQ